MGLERTPASRRRVIAARKRQEARWARLSGEVVVRKATEDELAEAEARRESESSSE